MSQHDVVEDGMYTSHGLTYNEQSKKMKRLVQDDLGS